jgi:hypothetical protein
MDRLRQTTVAIPSLRAVPIDRKRATIDFSTRDSLDYVPLMRLVRPVRRRHLSAGLARAHHISRHLFSTDGRRMIREIAACGAEWTVAAQQHGSPREIRPQAISVIVAPRFSCDGPERELTSLGHVSNR